MKTYHLFISHSWTHNDQFNKLVNLLDQAKNFSYHNHSIPKNDPVHDSTDKQLSKAIHNKIQPCGIVIVLAGVYAEYREITDRYHTFEQALVVFFSDIGVKKYLKYFPESSPQTSFKFDEN